MLKKLGQVIFKNRAGLMMLGAGLGVGAVAFFATKDAEDFKEVKEAWKVKEATGQEVTKKEKLIAYGKGHWRTGIAILSTELLMIFSFKSISKELAGATAALAVAISKHEEIEDYFRKNYPKEYKQFKETINKEKIEKIFNEHPELAKEPEDDRDLYYDPWSCQVFRATKAEILEAECFINEQMSNTGVATLFDYLATFPTSSGVKLDTWMQHFGWYEGDTVYSYSAGYYGSYLKPTIRVQNIIFKGEKLEVNAIEWVHDMDLEPELTTGEIVGIEHALEEAYENIA